MKSASLIRPVLRSIPALLWVLGLSMLVTFPAPRAARAALGDVLQSFPCAGPNTGDLAWVDGILYQVIFAPTDQKNIYRIDPADGTVLGTIPFAGSSPQGLVYDGRNLWECDLAGDTIYKLDPLTGAPRGQWAAPGGTDGQPIGLGWDGDCLWIGDSRDPEKIWRADTLGAVLGQIPAPGDSPYGLAWAGGFVWVSDNNLSGGALIYKLDPANGTILASFPCPNGGGAPNGITFDGEYLWVADNTTDMIYRIDDGIESGAVLPVRWTPGLVWGGISPHGGDLEVRFELERTAVVEIGLYNPAGRMEISMPCRSFGPGSHRVSLEADRLASGVYFARLASSGRRITARLIVVR